MPPLPFRTKLFYGMAGLTMNLPDLVIMQWLLVRYVPPNGNHLVPAALFGTIVLAARIVEGIGCTVIGHLSDECRSSMGRRLPFMRFGLVPFALVFFLVFQPPIDHMHWLNGAFAFTLVLTYFLLYGIIVTPYLALMPELTSDLKQRVDLTTAQSIFMLLATILFTQVGGLLQRFGWAPTIGGLALLLLIFFTPASAFLRERPRPAKQDHQPLRLLHSIILALKNRPFRFVVAATAAYWFGLNGIIALVPHWTVSYLGRTEGDVPKLMVPFLIVNVLFFFVFNLLTNKLGKYTLMLATFIASGAVMLLLLLVGVLPGDEFIQTAIVMALFGAPVAGFMVLPFAVLGDVVDYDEKFTGRRREAIFFGVQGIFQKIMIGVSVLTFTIVPYLGSIGPEKTPTRFGLKAMVLLCGLAAFLGFLIFLRYPLRDRGGKIHVVE